ILGQLVGLARRGSPSEAAPPPRETTCGKCFALFLSSRPGSSLVRSHQHQLVSPCLLLSASSSPRGWSYTSARLVPKSCSQTWVATASRACTSQASSSEG